VELIHSIRYNGLDLHPTTHAKMNCNDPTFVSRYSKYYNKNKFDRFERNKINMRQQSIKYRKENLQFWYFTNLVDYINKYKFTIQNRIGYNCKTGNLCLSFVFNWNSYKFIID
jgi:hypothetical protein